ncbi:MAG: DUF3786 domain-containing protein [Caldilineaceae bacterium]
MTYVELSADNSFYDCFTSALFCPEIGRFPSVQAVLENGRDEEHVGRCNEKGNSMTQQAGFVTNPAAAAAGRAAWNESFAPVLSELRDVLGKRAPERIAILSGVEWHAGTSEFRFHWLQTPYRITHGRRWWRSRPITVPCPANTQGLFLYYLATADGTPPAQRWIAFREL